MPCPNLRRCAAAAVVAATALVATACGDADSDDAGATPTETTVGPTTAPPPTTAAPPATTTAPPPTTAAATVTTAVPPPTTSTTVAPATTAPPDDGGTLIELSVGGDTARHQVSVGDDVTIVVVGDATDEVHLHGYDLLADLAPGSPATMTFTADIPGVFEIELHDAGTLLAELEVR